MIFKKLINKMIEDAIIEERFKQHIKDVRTQLHLCQKCSMRDKIHTNSCSCLVKVFCEDPVPNKIECDYLDSGCRFCLPKDEDFRKHEFESEKTRFNSKWPDETKDITQLNNKTISLNNVTISPTPTAESIMQYVDDKIDKINKTKKKGVKKHEKK